MTQKDHVHEEKWLAFLDSIDANVAPQAVRLMGDMRRISHSMHQISTASIANSGLTEAQYLVLMSLYMSEKIDGRSELNPSEISKWRGTSRNTISSLIRGLEDDGLVERHLDKQDRRKFNISLTEDGRTIISKYANLQFRTVGTSFNKLTQEERDTLSSLLNKLNQNLKDARSELEKITTQTGD